MNLLAHLNAEQRRAVTAVDGPVLVLAGAGTGKTRVITYRIAHLLALGAAPEAILAVTFTNKAAREMRERLAALVGKPIAKRVSVGTFHAFCARTLREWGEHVDLPAGFSIADAADQLGAVRAVLAELRVPDGLLRPEQIQARISLNKSRLQDGQPARAGVPDERDELVAAVQSRYDAQLRRWRQVDFDDLLLLTLRLLAECPAPAAALSARQRWILVDEYQDTNGPQYEIVRRLAGSERNLCVVGDDDQSIYGWRGADVTRILRFERDFPGATVVRLETNYRSTGLILEAANRVIAHNLQRHAKTLRSELGPGQHPSIQRLDDEQAEAEWIVADLVRRVQRDEVRLGDIAVLFRTGQQPRPLETALRAARVPYVLVGGHSFFDRKEVRDVLAYLRLIANPDDEGSWLRIVNRPPRGVGATSIERAQELGRERGLGAPAAFAAAAHDGLLTPAAAEGVTALTGLLDGLRADARDSDLVLTVRRLLELSGYRAEVDRAHKDPAVAEERWAATLEILDLAENYAARAANPSLHEFLERVALAAADDPTPEDAGQRSQLTLMTLHAAKGLEFHEVYLAGCEEGLLPHRRAVAEDGVDEERRLMYVGITRARRRLVLTLTASRSQHGSRQVSMPSRFLFEMTGQTPPAGWRAWGQEPEPRPAPRRAAKGRARRRS